MINSTGKKRVVITGVAPGVEHGRFPAKAIVGKPVKLSANVFTDGHDEIAARILLKHMTEKQWRILELSPEGNDVWSASFEPSSLGIYQFQVMSWVDHFTTWRKGLVKKYDAGQDVTVELQIGIRLAEAALLKASLKDKAVLQQWIAGIQGAGDTMSAVAVADNAAIAGLICTHKNKEMTTVYPVIFELAVEREKGGYSTWYELFPRSAGNTEGAHGTFRDVKELLPGISRMGYDVLYLPPVHPIGERNRKGKNNSLTAIATDPGSPWAIGNKTGGHKAIHPELGTLKDFKDLIKACRSAGMEIAMDIAFQCAPDHPYVKEHPEWFTWRPDGTVQYAENPPKKYEDILPFNFECDQWEALWEELKSVLLYWIGNGVEIFRVDNPHTKSFAFWEWVIRTIKATHPQVLFLAEAFTRPRLMERLAKAGFTQSYTYFTWRNTKKELHEYMTELTKTDLRYYFQPNFWPNTPDILPHELVTGGENNHIIRLILAATLSSCYGLYGPVYELGINEPMPGKEEYNDNEKYEIKKWDRERYTKTRELMTRINQIRKENAALQDTFNIEFAETTNDNIICYTKRDEQSGNTLIIAVNLDPHNRQSAMVKVPMDKIGKAWGSPLQLHDLLSDDRYTWQHEWSYVELDPNDMPAHIFRTETNI